ncbi:helix-turn-helix transcriptional regulator [Muriicola sp. Z0-33]|uniref:helix-turn-helix transcriptional regulator n=1 Tax=Muriicola sp. Z0-33 TaxID=2816957 RepID=UPI002237E9ED|nr:AraC family transcriptional regulator [Muriicola sp. Z0-33]MCW5517967.1 helix-turn-helix transcriptional regulator [Muriicola sp. Z0-33]
MTRDIIDINDFTILVETAISKEVIKDTCKFDEPVIAVAFYGSGNVDLEMSYPTGKRELNYTKGLALSFFADEHVDCIHTVSKDNPLECIVIATATRNLQNLPNQEGELFSELLDKLVNPKDHYVEGPSFFMTPEMHQVVDSLFNIEYEGKTKLMFFRSQITTLLSHFFGQLALNHAQGLKSVDKKRLEMAKEILSNNLDNPPSLTELSKELGLNTTKLKKEFKEVFGLPVFKYLQNERLKTAHGLISKKQATVQEAAWHVGYDSLSSFSNAFAKKFGYRPSQIK